MAYHDSGFTWTELYNMPIYLRKFYENLLIEQRKKENKEAERLNKKSP